MSKVADRSKYFMASKLGFVSVVANGGARPAVFGSTMRSVVTLSMKRCRRLTPNGPVVQLNRVTPLYWGIGSPQVDPYAPTQRFLFAGTACIGVIVNLSV